MRMTLVFACLQCNQYTIANVYNLHVLTYHQQERRLLPFADLVANDVGLFSEEAGEIAFSLLSRSTLGDSVEDKHKHLSNNFCAIGAMKDLNLSAMVAEDEDESPSYSRAFIENDDPEVIALQEHFRGVLRALEDSSFSSYPSVAFLKKNYRFSAPLTQEPSKTLVLNPRMQLQRVWANVRGLDRDWGQQFAERLGFDIQLHAPEPQSPRHDDEEENNERSSSEEPQPPARRPRLGLPEGSPIVSPADLAPEASDTCTGISSEY